MSKPKKGDAVYCTALHPHTPNTQAGVVHEIDGNICLFRELDGSINRFVWQFKSGLNKFYRIGEGVL